MSFTDEMWAEIRPIYDSILSLPFNRELAAGTLSHERFNFYMIQDAHYLGAFARALATAAAKAPTPEAQVKLAGSAKDAILVERALHEGFFREFGVGPERFATTPHIADLQRLLRLPAGHRLPPSLRRGGGGAAALLPDLPRGRQAAARARPRRPTPTSAGSTPTRTRRSASRCARCWPLPTPRMTPPGAAERLLMREAYLKAVRYEWMFWDSAYRLEAWPVSGSAGSPLPRRDQFAADAPALLLRSTRQHCRRGSGHRAWGAARPPGQDPRVPHRHSAAADRSDRSSQIANRSELRYEHESAACRQACPGSSRTSSIGLRREATSLPRSARPGAVERRNPQGSRGSRPLDLELGTACGPWARNIGACIDHWCAG